MVVYGIFMVYLWYMYGGIWYIYGDIWYRCGDIWYIFVNNDIEYVM